MDIVVKDIPFLPRHEALIQEKLRSGEYYCASEVIRDALYLMEDRDQILAWRKADLEAEIARSIDPADPGKLEPVDIEEIQAEAHARREAGRAKARADRQSAQGDRRSAQAVKE